LGPEDTPYEYAPFLIDLHLGPNYPQEPPAAHFHSWTHGLGRINPNLYEEGKICLSLLGTWQGKNDNESWSEKATILQILVSLQGLVFVKEPYYNEAGFETLQEERANVSEAMQYSEKAFVIARGFVKYALRSPIQGFEEVLAWLYLPRDSAEPSDSHRDHLRRVVQRSNSLIRCSENVGPEQQDVLLDGKGDAGSSARAFLKPLSKGAIVMLKRNMHQLEDMLKSLQDHNARQL
jgi:ubiquitin-conjugating enzyme E2 O